MRVFVTGGTGSLGGALVPVLLEAGHSVTVYSRDEVKQAEMHARFQEYNDRMRFVLGDVQDYDSLLLYTRHHDAVVHAAAYKRVPDAESNAAEAVSVNVIGSMNVARAAIHNNLECVVGVSTDKACAPINTYGVTKALMEKTYQQYDMLGGTRFVLVRYGNVLNSRGSVVPLFERQLKSERPFVTYTDPEMTRFWLTLDDAVDLVMAALDPSNSKYLHGRVLIPAAPASQMRVLARAVAFKLDVNHFEPQIIGDRPGEKKHESLIDKSEVPRTRFFKSSNRGNFSYYVIHPAYDENVVSQISNAYTSDEAVQLTVAQLAAML